MNNKKLFAFLILGVFLLTFVPLASAVQKSYDPNTRTIKLNDNFLWINTGDIATVQLITPLNYKVGLGYQKVAEMKVTGFKDYTDFITQMEFYDTKDNMKQFTREFDLKKKEIIQISVDDYECSKQLTTNSTNNTIETICVISGNHLEDRETWTKLHRVDFKKEDVLTIAMFTNVKLNDRIEWIPTIANKKINEWAVWTADLNTGIISYYKLDESSGTVIDSVLSSGNDGTNNGATPNVAGLINTGYSFDGSNDYIQVSSNLGITAYPFTISAWIKTSTSDNDMTIVDLADESIEQNYQLYLWQGNFRIMARNTGDGETSYTTSGTDYRDGNWHYVMGIFNSDTDKDLWVDGVLRGTATGDVTMDSSTTRFSIGRAGDPTPAQYFNGVIDEVGIWNRVLTPTEITQLYNNSYGISYTDSFDQNPTVTAISPANDTTVITTGSKDFTCYGSDDINFTSMEFYFNGSLDQTNSSGLNNTNYIFSKTLTDGNYNWTCLGNDNNSNTGTFTARTYSVDTTPNIQYASPNPIDTANLTANPTLNVTLTETYFQNITFNINGTETTYTDSTRSYTPSLTDGYYSYNVTTWTTTGQSNTTATRTFTLDSTAPSVLVTSPVDAELLVVNQTLNLNWTATDTHLDSCWYSYNETNNTLTCVDSSTTFNYIADINSLTFYANDTFGHLNTTVHSWDYDILEKLTTYSSSTTEGLLEDFQVELTVIEGILISSAILHYGDIEYSASISNADTEFIIFNNDLVIPNIDTDTNVTFFYELILGDDSIINTTSYMQEVTSIDIDDCSSFTFPIFTLSLHNEETRANLTGNLDTSITISPQGNGIVVNSFFSKFTSVQTKTYCSDINLTETNLILDATIRYSSTDYVSEFYHIQKADLSSYPKTINLYDIPENDSTEFKVTYQDSTLLPVPGAVIQLQRQEFENGEYLLVEAPLTSSESTALIHVNVKANKYRVNVVKDGITLGIFNDLVFKCESELTGECNLNLLTSIDPQNLVPIENIIDFSYSITSANNTITTTFSVPSGTPEEIHVQLIQKKITGTTIVCDKTVSSAAGSLSCDFDDSIEESSLELKVYKNDELLVEKGYILKEDLSDSFGGNNFFIVLILLLSLIGMAITSPEWMIVMSVVGLLLAGGLWLLNGMNLVAGLGALVWLVIAAIILITKISKQDDN